MRARRWGLGCSALLLIVLVVALDPCHVVLGLRWGNDPFDAQRWRDAACDKQDPYPNPRGRMVASLLRTHCLVGLTRGEVGALLGPPDQVDCVRRQTANPQTAAEWDYYLGAYSGFGVDEDVLIIEFGSEDRVVRHCVTNT